MSDTTQLNLLKLSTINLPVLYKTISLILGKKRKWPLNHITDEKNDRPCQGGETDLLNESMIQHNVFTSTQWINLPIPTRSVKVCHFFSNLMSFHHKLAHSELCIRSMVLRQKTTTNLCFCLRDVSQCPLCHLLNQFFCFVLFFCWGQKKRKKA